MARITDTRARVREIADKIAAEGGQPTPTLVRQLLGKGSPNTIVAELKAWAAERPVLRPAETPTGAMGTAHALERFGLEELAQLLRQMMVAQSSMVETVSHTRELSEKALASSEALIQLSDTCAQLAGQLKHDRAWMEEELNKVNERYEGVQRYMMMSIDNAREEARTWKQEATKAKEDLTAWKDAARRRDLALQEEIAHLKGKLEGIQEG